MPESNGRYGALTQSLVDALLNTPGETPSQLRRAVMARARSLAERGRALDGVPEALGGYVDKVAHHAYRITDEDVATLQRAGNSDNVLFELTVSAAVGSALGRLARGVAALHGEEPD